MPIIRPLAPSWRASALLPSLFAAGCTLGTADPEWGTDYYEPLPPGGAGGTHSTRGGNQGACTAAEIAGACAGDQLAYCDNGTAVVEDCAATGEVCGFDAANGWYDCQAKAGNVSFDPVEGCGTTTEVGLCEGNDLIFCLEGGLQGAHCAEKGLECGFDNAKDWFDCLDPETGKPPVADSCNGASAAGACDGETLVTCENGARSTTDCAASGGTCEVDGSGLASCKAIPPTGGCGEVDAIGVCNGDVVSWCDGGALQAIDCGDVGRACGWNADQAFYDCVDIVVTDECGDIDDVGTCDGATLSYCQDGALVTEECAFGCGWSEADGFNGCLAEPVAEPCGDVDEAGMCTGDTLLYCQDGALVTEECQFGCAWSEADGFNGCQAEPPPGPCDGVDAAGACDGNTLTYCEEGALVTEECAFGCGLNATSGLSECQADPGVTGTCDGVDAGGVCNGNTLSTCDAGTIVTTECAFGCGPDAAGLNQCLAEPVDPCAGVSETGTCQGDTLATCQDGAVVTETCEYGCGLDAATNLEACLPPPPPPEE